jgi:hypothetical protein
VLAKSSARSPPVRSNRNPSGVIRPPRRTSAAGAFLFI